MRYLKATFIGLVGGLLAAAPVLAVEFIYSQRVVASQIANCIDVTVGGVVCAGAAQFGGLEMPIAFALGFVVAPIIWFRRR